MERTTWTRFVSFPEIIARLDSALATQPTGAASVALPKLTAALAAAVRA